MKRLFFIALIVCTSQSAYSMEEPSMTDALGQVLTTLGIGADTRAAQIVSLATAAAAVYSFGEIAYRRYYRWLHSNDPKKADFDGFVKSLANDTFTEMGVVTYEELEEAIQRYLDAQDLQLTHDEVADIARDVAQQIVDERAQKLSARLDVLEQAETVTVQI